MNDLYDIITALRLRNRMSLRMLATTAKLPPTTLASIMTRRPTTIDKEILIRIALALNVKWVDLLNKPDSYAEGCQLEERIPVEMSPEDIEAVREKLVDSVSAPDFVEEQVDKFTRIRTRYCPDYVKENDFKSSFMFVIDKLNDDGLLEAMKRVLEVAGEPKFRKKNKEDKECQEEELRMAAEQSESGLMDAGRLRPL